MAESCGVGRRCCSDPTLLWLWCRLATVAPIQPLAWKPPYAVSVALKKKKRQRKWTGWTCVFPITPGQGDSGAPLGLQGVPSLHPFS